MRVLVRVLLTFVLLALVAFLLLGDTTGSTWGRRDQPTTGSTVTLTGTVRSAAERDRAVALARETAGVTTVVDRLEIGR